MTLRAACWAPSSGPGSPVPSSTISDYLAFVTGGELTPGDDAADARWVTPAEAAEMDAAGQLTGELLATLRSWSVLP